MAELLVVGLAKTVVQAALSKVKAAIEEEANLRESARGNMVLITLEFEMIHSFLDVATEERVKNNLVKTWVRQVRELAYDLEDCIEFVVHLDNKSTWYLRLFPCWPSPPLPVDLAVAEIQQMRTRAEELSKSYLRYSHIMDSDPKLFKLQQHVTSGDAAGVVALNMLLRARGATERQPCFRDLAQLITKKDIQELQVISVWETVDGDLGTTSIISKAFNDLSFVQHFTARAWVKLMHPFDPHDFIRSLVAQFYSYSCKESTMVGMDVLTKMGASNEDLAKEFEQLVKTKRYLIVLEDLSNMVEWHGIRMFLPDMKNGSCIIISTQRFEIASLCVGHPYQLTELKQFSDEHSVCALFKEGSQGDGHRGDEPMVSRVRQSFSYSYKNVRSKRGVANDRMNNSPLVGRELELNVLRQYASKEFLAPSKVISVWGMAGVGKTALVRNLYNDRTYEQFSNYSWVDVSHPFNLNDFCRSILLDSRSEKDPVEECRLLLNNHRCLLVIDDLQTMREWDMIQTALLSKHPIGVIIIITSDARIATYCASKEELVFHVQCLEDDDAINLFKMEVHRKNPSSSLMDQKDVELKQLVLMKCGSLPKVIIAVADVLAGQTVTRTDIVFPLNLNKRFIHHLETKPEYDNLRGLLAWMDSKFRTCPDSLKPCIFYLSIFGPDLPIRRRRLVRRWIAEGYSRDKHEESADENGEKQFSSLLDLSLIQQPSHRIATGALAPGDTRMVMCQVNGFIHEYIVSRQMEENFVFELRGHSALTTDRTGRHLIIQECWKRDINVFESIDFSRLRSLTVFGSWKPFFISERMMLLRVLDLENASVSNDVVEYLVKTLPRLKFLSLRGCHEIDHLPTSLGDLRQLQTLDVRGTSIVTLPPSIIKLYKLQYIRAGRKIRSAPSVFQTRWLPKLCKHNHRHDPKYGVVVPERIGNLRALHTLGVVNVDVSKGKILLRHLRSLTQLRKLGVSGINRNNITEFFRSILWYAHLESLSMELNTDSNGCLDSITQGLENLQSLKLYGLNDKLPGWSARLSKLTKLYLETATLTEDDMKLLAKLPQLRILRVKQLKDGQLNFHIDPNGEESDSYQRVNVLQIACGSSSSTLHVKFGSETMMNLELLKVDCCDGSPPYEFSGLENLRELKQVLLLNGSNAQALKEQLESQLAEHPNKPVVKLEEPPRSF